MRGQHHYADLRVVAANRQRGLESLGRVVWGHANVNQRQVRPQLTHEVKEARRIAGLADHIEARALEQAGQPLAQEHVVLGHDDPAPVRGGV